MASFWLRSPRNDLISRAAKLEPSAANPSKPPAVRLVAKLVAGGGAVFICDACVALCDEYVAGRTPNLSHFTPPEKLPTPRLLAQLPAVETTVRGKGSQLQWVVDELRRRKVSWADIGEALGVSRQSAWERFS